MHLLKKLILSQAIIFLGIMVCNAHPSFALDTSLSLRKSSLSVSDLTTAAVGYSSKINDYLDYGADLGLSLDPVRFISEESNYAATYMEGLAHIFVLPLRDYFLNPRAGIGFGYAQLGCRSKLDQSYHSASSPIFKIESGVDFFKTEFLSVGADLSYRLGRFKDGLVSDGGVQLSSYEMGIHLITQY